MDGSRIPQASPEVERRFEERGLTDRERDAVRSALRGMTAAAAAEVMGVSASTVGSLRQRAYRKLGVRGAAELGEKDEDSSADATPADDAVRAALLAHGLSETQADVLTLVAAGRSSAEIAEALSIALGTVSSARANGYRMLGVHSREELAALLAEEAAAPRRRRARRLALACVAAVMVVTVAVAVGESMASVPLASDDADGEPALAQNQAVPSDGAFDRTGLYGVTHRGGIVRLEDAVHDYDELGVKDVQVKRLGDVDEESCVILESLSDGDSRTSETLFEGATIYLTVTSEITLPMVIDMDPMEATRTLLDMGLIPDPAFNSYSRPPDDDNIHAPRVESVSIDGEPVGVGAELRVGTVVHLEFDRPPDGYSWKKGSYFDKQLSRTDA